MMIFLLFITIIALVGIDKTRSVEFAVVIEYWDDG